VPADEELGLIVEASAIVHTPGSHVVRVFTLRTLHHGVTDLNDVAITVTSSDETRACMNAPDVSGSGNIRHRARRYGNQKEQQRETKI